MRRFLSMTFLTLNRDADVAWFLALWHMCCCVSNCAICQNITNVPKVPLTLFVCASCTNPMKKNRITYEIIQKNNKSYPHQKCRKISKKVLIHQVMHIIHMWNVVYFRIKIRKIKRLFWHIFPKVKFFVFITWFLQKEKIRNIS